MIVATIGAESRAQPVRTEIREMVLCTKLTDGTRATALTRNMLKVLKGKTSPKCCEESIEDQYNW